jgi:hypothetical protein
MCCAIHIIVSFNFKWSCASFTLLSVSIFFFMWKVNGQFGVHCVCMCSNSVVQFNSECGLWNMKVNSMWMWPFHYKMAAPVPCVPSVRLQSLVHRRLCILPLHPSNHLSTIASVYYFSTIASVHFLNGVDWRYIRRLDCRWSRRCRRVLRCSPWKTWSQRMRSSMK